MTSLLLPPDDKLPRLIASQENGTYEDLQLEEGVFFTGTVEGGKACGEGVLRTPEGTYRGTFCDSSACGQGELLLCSGDRYVGAFEGGAMSGTGEYAAGEAGAVYRGSFAHNQRHGMGRMEHPNGDYYDGTFIEGEVTGYGTFYSVEGRCTYVGLWEKGRKVKGRLTFKGSQRVYEGEWRHEKPSGKGVMVFQDGNRYVGDFANGTLEGVGLLRYAVPKGGAPTEKVYYGQFYQGKPCGLGTLFTQSPGEEAGHATEGYFDDGVLLDAGDRAGQERVRERTIKLPDPEHPAPFLLGRVYELTRAMPATAAAAAAPPAPAAEEVVPPRVLPQSVLDVLDVSLSTSACSSLSGSEIGDADALMRIAAPLGEATEFYEDSCKGWLEKFSIGRKKISVFSNWKRRYFILARFNNVVCLGYYEDELGRRPVGFLRLNPADARLVPFPTVNTHRKADKYGRDFCVLYKENKVEYRLLMRAVTTEDHDRWVTALSRHLPYADA